MSPNCGGTKGVFLLIDLIKCLEMQRDPGKPSVGPRQPGCHKGRVYTAQHCSTCGSDSMSRISYRLPVSFTSGTLGTSGITRSVPPGRKKKGWKEKEMV